MRAFSLSMLIVASSLILPAFGADPLDSQGLGQIPGTSLLKPDLQFLALPAFDAEAVAPAGTKSGTLFKVGDEIVLRISGLNIPGVSQPGRELKIALSPGTEDLNKQGVEILSEQVQASSADQELRFSLTALKAGKITVPSLSIQDAGGKSVARVNPFTLEIQSAIKADDKKPDQPADFKPPVSLAFPIWVVLLGSFLILALVGGIIYWLVQKSKKTPVKASYREAPKPEDEVALIALAKLEREGVLASGKFKVFYFRISEILKVYLGARYLFDARESTSSEILAHLESQKTVSVPLLGQLESVFQRLDRVKFTDHIPLPTEGQALFTEVREFVLKTKKILPPPQTVANAPVISGAKRAP